TQETTPMKRTTILALTAILCVPSITLAAAPAAAPAAGGATSRPAAATTKPGSSDFSLTIYSTADPATFDPQQLAQQLAQQRLMNPYNAWQMKLPGYGVVRETRKIDIKEGE